MSDSARRDEILDHVKRLELAKQVHTSSLAALRRKTLRIVREINDLEKELRSLEIIVSKQELEMCRANTERLQNDAWTAVLLEDMAALNKSCDDLNRRRAFLSSSNCSGTL